MQLKYSSTLPFGIYNVVVESYIGSYVKRWYKWQMLMMK
jgi:hypothetical protein